VENREYLVKLVIPEKAGMTAMGDGNAKGCSGPTFRNNPYLLKLVSMLVGPGSPKAPIVGGESNTICLDQCAGVRLSAQPAY